MDKGRTVDVHPVYCSCCPSKPVVMAEQVGDHLLEIQSRKHGRTHVVVIRLDKRQGDGVDSESETTE